MSIINGTVSDFRRFNTSEQRDSNYPIIDTIPPEMIKLLYTTVNINTYVSVDPDMTPQETTTPYAGYFVNNTTMHLMEASSTFINADTGLWYRTSNIIKGGMARIIYRVPQDHWMNKGTTYTLTLSLLCYCNGLDTGSTLPTFGGFLQGMEAARNFYSPVDPSRTTPPQAATSSTKAAYTYPVHDFRSPDSTTGTNPILYIDKRMWVASDGSNKQTIPANDGLHTLTFTWSNIALPTWDYDGWVFVISPVANTLPMTTNVSNASHPDKGIRILSCTLNYIPRGER